MSECVTKIKDSEAMYLRVKQYLNISFKSSPALFRRGLQMTTTALKENGPIGTLARSAALPTFYLQQCWNKKWNPHDFLNSRWWNIYLGPMRDPMTGGSATIA